MIATANTARMTITAAGRVGIGTMITDPQYKLDVADGDMRLGALDFSENVTRNLRVQGVRNGG